MTAALEPRPWALAPLLGPRPWALQKWSAADESKHPRDDRGRWTDGLYAGAEVRDFETDAAEMGDAWWQVHDRTAQYAMLYHVTPIENAERIVEEGFVPGKVVGPMQGFAPRHLGTYGWASRERALFEVQRAVEQGGSDWGDFAIIAVKVPRSHFGHLRADEDVGGPADSWQESYDTSGAAVYEGAVPRGWIETVLVDRRSLEKAYDPNQPRDPKGSETGGRWRSRHWTPELAQQLGQQPDWTPEKGADAFWTAKPETPAERLAVLQGMAKELGFDPARVQYVDEDGGLLEVLGADAAAAGRRYAAVAGTQDYASDPYIRVYRNAFDTFDERAVMGLMAHEVQHHRFSAVMAQLSTEMDQLSRGGFLRPDDTIRTVPVPRAADMDIEEATRLGLRHLHPLDAKAQYPVAYRLIPYLRAPGAVEALQRDDGFTGYSRDWWAAGRPSAAIDETLAEIAHYEHHPERAQQAPGVRSVVRPDGRTFLEATPAAITPPSTHWRGLYRAVNASFRELNRRPVWQVARPRLRKAEDGPLPLSMRAVVLEGVAGLAMALGADLQPVPWGDPATVTTYIRLEDGRRLYTTGASVAKSTPWRLEKWSEAEHPRYPSGSARGGEFAPAAGGEGAALLQQLEAEAVPAPEPEAGLYTGWLLPSGRVAMSTAEGQSHAVEHGVMAARVLGVPRPGPEESLAPLNERLGRATGAIRFVAWTRAGSPDIIAQAWHEPTAAQAGVVARAIGRYGHWHLETPAGASSGINAGSFQRALGAMYPGTVIKYDPGQRRDERGRWVDEPGTPVADLRRVASRAYRALSPAQAKVVAGRLERWGTLAGWYDGTAITGPELWDLTEAAIDQHEADGAGRGNQEWRAALRALVGPVSEDGLVDAEGNPVVKYDPAQPRDPAGSSTGGQWTSTGAPGTREAVKKPRRDFGGWFAHLKGEGLKKLCAETGVDPKLVTVKWGEPPKKSVGGMSGSVAGRYTPKTGRIELYAMLLGDVRDAREVLAHETAHLRFAKAWKDKAVRSFVSDNFAALRRADGVTKYSRAHWRHFDAIEEMWDGKAPGWARALVVDETLATIAGGGRARGPYVRLARMVQGGRRGRG